MRIAIVGAGGVGGYFGARLAASGQDVWFIARGAQLEAMRRDGLQVRSANGDVLVKPVNATDRAAEVGPVDVVMITVKLWSTDEALADAKPLVGPGTAVVSVAAVANHSYTVQYSDNLSTGGWLKLGDVVAQSVDRVATLMDPTWTSNRFYRVVLPGTPQLQ